MSKNKSPHRYLFGIVEYRQCIDCSRSEWVVLTPYDVCTWRYCAHCGEAYWF